MVVCVSIQLLIKQWIEEQLVEIRGLEFDFHSYPNWGEEEEEEENKTIWSEARIVAGHAWTGYFSLESYISVTRIPAIAIL